MHFWNETDNFCVNSVNVFLKILLTLQTLDQGQTLFSDLFLLLVRAKVFPQQQLRSLHDPSAFGRR